MYKDLEYRTSLESLGGCEQTQSQASSFGGGVHLPASADASHTEDHVAPVPVCGQTSGRQNAPCLPIPRLIVFLRMSLILCGTRSPSWFDWVQPTFSLMPPIIRCCLILKLEPFYEGQGWDLDRWLARGIEMDNAVISDFPEVTFGFHL